MVLPTASKIHFNLDCILVVVKKSAIHINYHLNGLFISFVMQIHMLILSSWNAACSHMIQTVREIMTIDYTTQLIKIVQVSTYHAQCEKDQA